MIHPSIHPSIVYAHMYAGLVTSSSEINNETHRTNNQTCLHSYQTEWTINQIYICWTVGGSQRTEGKQMVRRASNSCASPHHRHIDLLNFELGSTLNFTKYTI
ncbi:hypothetical protein AMECASPLE_022084 [Ameca splendens]|uniref:Uncharacterized protein n=1 Tax=Ameca splendens TaxID=208324 RepID=A0ABV0Y4B6_9TELE